MAIDTGKAAIFRAVVKHDGKMIAGLASLPGGKARFFVLQRRESDETFVGRVSQWIKDQGAEGLQMSKPDVIPEGASIPETLLRLRVALAADDADPDAAEFDVKNVDVVLGEAAKGN